MLKSRPHHDAAPLHLPTNVPTKYQLLTPYFFRGIAQTKFKGSRSLQQGQRANQGHTMMLYTYTPNPMSLPIINTLHLTGSRDTALTGFFLRIARPPALSDTMGENNIHTALKGSVVKSQFLELLGPQNRDSLKTYKVKGINNLTSIDNRTLSFKVHKHSSGDSEKNFVKKKKKRFDSQYRFG